MALKKEVIVCDECNGKIAVSKCDICERDICNSCFSGNSITLKGNSLFIFRICRKCNERLRDNKFKFNINQETIDSIKRQIIEQYKTQLLLFEIEKG